MNATNNPQLTDVICITQQWLTNWILRYNLCPFAHRVHQENRIRYNALTGGSIEAYIECIHEEIVLLLNEHNAIDTTLLALPTDFEDFEDFLDFVGLVDMWIEQNEWEGVVQAVAFHPRFVFEEEAPQSKSHYTNRSPYPIIHLLKEESVSQAIANFADVHQIPKRNIDKLNTLEAKAFEWLDSFITKQQH